jgi:hypothetical protein
MRSFAPRRERETPPPLGRGMVGVSRSTLRLRSPKAQELLKQALALGEEDRASIAGVLMESVHGEMDLDAEEAWDEAIKQRISQLDARAVRTLPWPEVSQRLFQGSILAFSN